MAQRVSTPVILDISFWENSSPENRTPFFKNMVDVGWHDCHMALRWQFTYTNSSQLNVTSTNTSHIGFRVNEEIDTLEGERWLGMDNGYGRQWNSSEVGEKLFKNFQRPCIEIEIGLYQLRNKTVAFVGWFYIIGEQCTLYQKA